MDYGEIFLKAWQIIWKHKVLWIFGILAGCGSAGGSSANSGYRASGNEAPTTPWLNNLEGWQIAIFIALAIIVILLVMALVAFLSTIGRVGLIQGTQRADRGAEKLLFIELFDAGKKFFWRVFGLQLGVGLLVLILVLILAVPGVLLAAATAGIALICLIPLICLAVPLAWVGSVIIEQATIAIIIEDISIQEGLQRAWQLVRANLGPYIVVALAMMVVGVISGAIVGAPLLAVLPFMLGGLALGGGTGAVIGGLVCLCLYMPILLVLSGIVTAYTTSAWTLTYLRLSGRPPTPANAVL